MAPRPRRGGTTGRRAGIRGVTGRKTGRGNLDDADGFDRGAVPGPLDIAVFAAAGALAGGQGAQGNRDEGKNAFGLRIGGAARILDS